MFILCLGPNNNNNNKKKDVDLVDISIFFAKDFGPQHVRESQLWWCDRLGEKKCPDENSMRICFGSLFEGISTRDPTQNGGLVREILPKTGRNIQLKDL